MTDNIAILEGFTRKVIAETGEHILLLLMKPDTDLTSCFKAWDTDAQEFIEVFPAGWTITDTEDDFDAAFSVED